MEQENVSVMPETNEEISTDSAPKEEAKTVYNPQPQEEVESTTPTDESTSE